MEYNNRGGNGRRQGEGRRDYGTRRPRIGESRSYDEGRKSFGNRKPYGNDERRSYNDGGSEERRSYGNPQRRNFGERNAYGNEGRNFGGERRPYNSGERRPYGERRSFGANGERKNFGEDRRGFGEERRNFGEERRSFGEDRRGFGDNRRPGRRPRIGEDRRGGTSYGNRKPSYGRGFNKGFNNRFERNQDSGINKMIERKRMMDEAAFSDNDMISIPVKEEVRLNKFISNSGICSRREADNFILAGVVTVNGEVVTELGTKVNINTDDIRFNGERLKGEEKVYIVMNKPKGYVTTASDPHAEKTVMDLIKGCKSRVFPVGRLDKNTTGVLMFTNDGEMAEKLTHPAYNKKKIYQVNLDKNLTQEDFDKIVSGVVLTDGEIAADELEYVEENDHRKIGIEIHSGKNRIVRRIFESLGYEVKALDRVYFAGLTKKNLKKGHWRFLTEGEVNILKMGAYK